METEPILPRLSLRLLGSPVIAVAGRPAATDRRKAVALLAYLAVTATPHRRDALAGLFWPDFEPAAAYAYLRRTLWELHQVLGDASLETTREQVQFMASKDAWVDVAAFQELARQGKMASNPDTLKAAVEVYRGSFMAGFSLADAPEFDNWQRYQAEFLQNELGTVLSHLAAAYERLGDFEEALTWAQRWTALDELNEAAHRLVMRLYARAGNRPGALRQYEALARALQRELAAAPDSETEALAAAIRKGSGRELPVQGTMPAPQLQPIDEAKVTTRVRLPAPATHFVGRSAELQAIKELLTEQGCRLLTLVGPGGAGKTRLAIEAAQRSAEAFPDGVYFVSLAALDEPEQALSATAEALSFSFRDVETGVRQQLLDFVRNKRLLLVFDNCEHLVRGDGFTLPPEILEAAAEVAILATSRVRLQVKGEQVYNVEGLELPGQGTPPPDVLSSGLELFVESARRVLPGFGLDDSNAGDVTRICRMVDGMPLAIEMAAGWVGVLPPSDILVEMKRDIAILETDLRDVPTRQRSMRTVFDASWSFLTGDEQDAYRRLSVFRGSFSREAAQVVAGTSLRTLQALVNKSMLRRTGDGRFDLHPLLAQYAGERLHADAGSELETRRRYAVHYLGFLESHGRAMQGPGQRTALDAIMIEGEHVRAAWLQAIEMGWHAAANAVLLPMFYFHAARSYLALDGLLAAALDILDQQDRGEAGDLLLARLLAVRSFVQATAWWPSRLSQELGRRGLALVREHQWEADMGAPLALLGVTFVWHIDRDTGVELLAEAEARLREAGDMFGLVIALNQRASALDRKEERPLAKRLLVESIELSRRLGSPLQLAESLAALAGLAVLEQDYDLAVSLFEESQVLTAQAGDEGTLSMLAYRLGDVYLSRGDYVKAVTWFSHGRQLSLALGDRRGAANVLSWMSIAYARTGDVEAAMAHRKQSLLEFQALGDWHGLAWAHWEMGELHRQQGDLAAAKEQYHQSAALFSLHDIERGLVFSERSLGDLALAEGDIERAERHFQTSLDLASKQEYTWAEAAARCGQGRVAMARQDYELARRCFLESLQRAREWADMGLIMVTLLGAAQYLAVRDDPEAAVAVLAYLFDQPATWPEQRADAERLLAALGPALPADVHEAAASKGRGLTLDQIASQYLGGA